MTGFSVPELVLIGVIALVVFGPSKLPEVGAAVGKTIKEFKKSMNEMDKEPERKTAVPEQRDEPRQIDAPAVPKKDNDPHNPN